MVVEEFCLRFISSRAGRFSIFAAFILGLLVSGAFVFYSSLVIGTHEGGGGTNCWDYDGNLSGCNLQSGCTWTNNNATVQQNPFCPVNITTYNNTQFINRTGNLLVNAGCCMSSGQSQGCYSFDGTNQSTCEGDSSCQWKPNDANQNPWCPNNKGCCNKKGCWSFNGNKTTCEAAFQGGLCGFFNKTQDPYCSDTVGCCSPKPCAEIAQQGNCTRSQSQGGSPCEWTGSACQFSGGGFGFYNSTDSCVSKGGWWNGSDCQTPGSGGGGGFLYASDVKCYFGDNNPGVCGNVSGCVYCDNSTTEFNNASSACYQKGNSYCAGHDPSRWSNWNGTATVNVTDANQTTMVCNDIRLKQICNCGPLPNCVWSNSTSSTGAYCTTGLKSDSDRQSCTPTVQFCEDPKAKSNQTLCNELADNFMMPCKWNTDGVKNCSFSGIACFGTSSGGSVDFTSIPNQVQCIAAGGSWKSEYYLDSDGSFKQDSWCEKGALFSFTTGQASGNKGNCDSDCWACEFNSTGGSWRNLSDSVLQGQTKAEQNCRGSKKGVCIWRNDTEAPNGLGWCDYPREFSSGGSEDCNEECKACEFYIQSSPVSACFGSKAGCSWINDSNSPKGGFCLSSSKKSCSTDCFSCGDQSFCANNTYHPSLNCSWDATNSFCKPYNFAGEICFNGKDDDSDQKSDCGDPDCSFDQFCGGGNIGSSGGIDCKKISDLAACAANKSSSGKNCTVVTPTWGGASYCDYPGSNCWQHETNVTACTNNWLNSTGCVWKNASSSPVFTGYCMTNETAGNFCFNATNFANATNCASNSNCVWTTDSYSQSGGRCEFRLFNQCGNRTTESTCCSGGNCVLGGGNCSWKNDSYSFSGGFCEPICFGRLNSSQCVTAGSGCNFKATTCEPELFTYSSGGGGKGYGCHQYDMNYTGCVLQNLSCAWQNFTIGNKADGICNEKGHQNLFSEMDRGPPKILGMDLNDSSQHYVDIRGFGIKDMNDALGFGIVVTNISNASVCKGYYIQAGMMASPVLGGGNASTEFYWYLDTNKNTTDGCNMTYQNGSVEKGYEFFMKYAVGLNNGSVEETKSFLKCSGGNWVLTNVPLTSNRQFMCGLNMPIGPTESLVGGVLVIVDKESLESFSQYNKSVPMRVVIASGNDSASENAPTDSVSAPGYYTPGSADFKFVDCSNPDVKDEKCKHFQKYGFNVYEDCKNGKDDDSDDLEDCEDPQCGFTPACSGTGFNFIADPNDQSAPTVVFSQVDALHNGALVKFDTDEPANGSLDFFKNDSSCSSANITIAELGDPSFAFDDYKPFHLVPLEENVLGYALANGTVYYYKTTICDPSGNCGVSGCLNFTTKVENQYKNFIFKMKLPPGFNVTIPALNYSGNFTTTVGGNVYEAGIKTNASVSRNINVTVHCNVGGTQSLTFVGVDLLKPKSIDLTTAFVCDTSNRVLGMNSTSKSWNQVIGDLGLGGRSDHVRLTFPVAYDSANTVKWCDDALTNCTTVNNYANCSSGGSGKTDCKIPTSLGFSAYQISLATSDTGGSSGGGGGGGGSGGKTYSVTQQQVEAGYTQSLAKGDAIKFTTSDTASHTVSVNEITATSAKITVASTPQTIIFNVGESKKFELTGDQTYDLQVTLNSISSGKASVTVIGINDAIPQTPSQQPAPTQDSDQPSQPSEETPTSGGTGTGLVTDEIETGGKKNWIWLIVAVVVIAGVAWAVIAMGRRKR